jgi:hypothetical protein
MLVVVLGTLFDFFKRHKFMKLLSTTNVLHTTEINDDETQIEEINAEKLYVLRISRKIIVIIHKNYK